jgi:glucose-6-phosphate isomerase
MSKGDRITFDPRGALSPDDGVSATALAALATQLDDVRSVMTAGCFEDGELSPEERFFPERLFLLEQPERTLDEYVEQRGQSVLGRVLHAAGQLRDRVDRIVVLGNRNVEWTARALLDACCEPCFNELSRGQRGSRPRVYFAGSDLDNDATAGLLTLLTEGQSPDWLKDRWAILVCDDLSTSPQTRAVFRHFLSALRSFYRGDAARVAESVIPVGTASATLSAVAETLGCTHAFINQNQIDQRFLIFSPVGLLPAAILGVDVVRLLEGASAMNDHFRTAPVGANAVLDFVGIGHLWKELRHVRIRGLRIWASALESAARWYVHLRERGVGLSPKSVLTPPGCVLWTNLIVEQCRCDPLAFGWSELAPDGWSDLDDRTQPELLSSAICETARRDQRNGIPSADIRLARLNEHTLGQLVQLWMLAAVAEQMLASSDSVTDSNCEGRFGDFAVRFLYGPPSTC